MNILFISYWGIGEGLTAATVIPHVHMLARNEKIRKIILITIERHPGQIESEIADKILHIPVPSHSIKFGTPGQILDFLLIPAVLKRYCTQFQVRKIIARGVLAGALASKTAKKIRIPYYVESFEPHADYMKDSGVWKRWGLKYLTQKRWEHEQLRSASGILTVNEAFSRYLRTRTKIDARILTVPCAVDTDRFKMDQTRRKTIRQALGIDRESVVGIYAGKFGGLYLETSELGFLRPVMEFFPDLVLIFLTNASESDIKKDITQLIEGAPRIIVRSVAHDEVPDYLSAADFAFSFVKSFKSARFNSPVKHGEYWASGLPIIMMEGVGDEEEFREAEQARAAFNAGKLGLQLPELRKVIQDDLHRKKIAQLAGKFRSFSTVKKAYDQLITPDAADEEGHSPP